MAWKLTVNGVDKTSLVNTDDRVQIELHINERATASFKCKTSLTLAKFDEVVIYGTDGTTKVFGGIVLQRETDGSFPTAGSAFQRASCADFAAYTDFCHTSLTYTSGPTLKAVLTDIVSTHLSTYGISLDAGQVTGPTLEAFAWQTTRVSDALRELSDKTGYVFRVDPSKKLKMFVPGTDSAPFNISDATPHCTRLSWQDSSATPTPNKVILICGPSTTAVRTERFIGDGSTTSWVMSVPAAVSGWYPGYVTVNGIFLTVGTGASYTWNDATSTLAVGTAPTPGVGDTIDNTYTAQYPFTVTATSGGSPVVEKLFARTDLLEPVPAQEVADGLLDQLDQAPRTMTALSLNEGWLPGQAFTVALTARSLTGNFVVQSVSITISVTHASTLWEHDLNALESTITHGGYLQEWRDLLGSSSDALTVLDGQGGSTGIEDSLYDAGNSGTAKTIDWLNGKAQKLLLTGNCTLTFSNPRDGGRYVLVLKQDGSGGHTVTYPASVKWDNDNVPWMSSLAAAGVLTTYLYISSLTKYMGCWNSPYGL